ncbi:MAG: hypothetical protein M3Z23_03425 [Acidobacteriota bacterium]|nr:hypothetical protein [Acidobacteriota bacterium]
MSKAVLILRTFLTIAVLCATSSLLAQDKSQDETVDWLDNYKQAIKEAKRTQKPIFLEFRCEA